MDRQEQGDCANSNRAGDGNNGDRVGPQKTGTSGTDCHAGAASFRCSDRRAISVAGGNRVALAKCNAQTDCSGRTRFGNPQSTSRCRKSASRFSGNTTGRESDAGCVRHRACGKTRRFANPDTEFISARFALTDPRQTDADANTFLNGHVDLSFKLWTPLKFH